MWISFCPGAAFQLSPAQPDDPGLIPEPTENAAFPSHRLYNQPSLDRARPRCDPDPPAARTLFAGTILASRSPGPDFGSAIIENRKVIF